MSPLVGAWSVLVVVAGIRAVRGRRRLPSPRRAPVDRARLRRVGGIALVVVVAPFAPPLAAAIVLVLLLRPRLEARRALRRHDEAVVATLPDVVDLFVVAAAAGLTVPMCVAAVGPRAPPPWDTALQAAERRVTRGALVGDSVRELGREIGPRATGLVAVLRDAARDGAPLEPGLRRVAADARDLRRRRAEERARRVPVRLLLPLVTCVLPAFGLLAVTPLVVGAFRSLDL